MDNIGVKVIDKNKIVELLSQALKYKDCLVKLHLDHASAMAHINMHGFKRLHECQEREEMLEFICLRRFIDDEYFKRIVLPISDYKDFQYMTFNQELRTNISNDEKITILKKLLEDWKIWEIKYCEKLENIIYELRNEKDSLAAEHIECLVIRAREEMKQLRRITDLYDQYSWKIEYIAVHQSKMHDECEDRMKNTFHLDIA